MKQFFSLMCLLSVILLSSCSQRQPPVGSNSSQNKTELMPLNEIILLDLSDRIHAPGQSARDVDILHTMFALFQKRQKNLLKSSDVLTVAIAHQRDTLGEVAGLLDDLSLDMGTFRTEDQFNARKAKFEQAIDRLYEVANQSPTHGADIYSFFENDLTKYLKPAEKYRNKLIIITDGYLSFDESSSRPKGTYLSETDLRLLREHGANWEAVFFARDMGLNSESIHIAAESLQIMLIEVAPRAPTIHVYEQKILERFWKKWFAGLGIFDPPIFLQQGFTMETIRSNLIDFLESKALQSRLTVPIKLNGDSYRSYLHPNNEIVQNLKGKYVIIDISSTSKVPLKRTLFFRPGEYWLNFDESRMAFAEFNDSVLRLLRNSEFRDTYEVFFWGNADSLPMRGNRKLVVGHDDQSFKSFDVYKHFKESDFIFAGEPTNIKIENLTNENLPNLRGRFLQLNFDNQYSGSNGKKSKESKILDGTVSTTVSEYFRRGSFILYLPDGLFEG